MSLEKITLRTPRLTLSALREKDAAALIALFRHKMVNATYMVPDLADETTAARLFSRMRELSLAADHCVFGIFLDDTLIGIMNDTEIDSDTIEMGYALHPDHSGHGYMTEAFSAVIAHLRARGFARVTAGAFEENAASLRVLQKCGMIPLPKTDEIEYRGRKHVCIYYTTPL
ncbi:MAG: GNAT family N-acetyltransferase [Clostridia bacterium]|nr:GNAT family N-acetyltransferase [Clostridia bacterium]